MGQPLFVAVEPKGGKRVVSEAERRVKIKHVEFINELLNGVKRYVPPNSLGEGQLGNPFPPNVLTLC